MNDLFDVSNGTVEFPFHVFVEFQLDFLLFLGKQNFSSDVDTFLLKRKEIKVQLHNTGSFGTT